MAPANNAVHTEQIVRDITGSILCSYQITPAEYAQPPPG